MKDDKNSSEINAVAENEIVMVCQNSSMSRMWIKLWWIGYSLLNMSIHAGENVYEGSEILLIGEVCDTEEH